MTTSNSTRVKPFGAERLLLLCILSISALRHRGQRQSCPGMGGSGGRSLHQHFVPVSAPHTKPAPQTEQHFSRGAFIGRKVPGHKNKTTRDERSRRNAR